MQQLLLLHGALGSAADFNSLKELLSGSFEVHSFDFDSHGRREVSETISINRFADEVLEYLRQQQIDKISIFGYSMGGYVGLYLARHYPQKIEKLFTLATKLDWTIQGAAKEAAMLNADVIIEKVPKYAASLEQLHGNHWKSLVEKTAQMMISLGADPALKPEDFAQISCPALLAVGDKDVMVSIAETQNVQRLLPNSKLLVLPETPHPIGRVNAGQLARQIGDFLL